MNTSYHSGSRREHPEGKKTARERFFAIDARSWPKVCELGMPAAISYLVLASGSGGDQTTTRWSVDAITRHTGVGRPRAKTAVAALAEAGLIRIEKGGTRPQYSIVHAHQRAERQPLTPEEQRIYNIIVGGNNAAPKIGRHDNVWQRGKPYETAIALVQKGYLDDRGGYEFIVIESQVPSEKTEQDLIWLPCSLIETSKEDGPVTPVEQIRQSNNISALRLFIDLYHAHDLINGPGINWRPPHGLRFEYERIPLGQRGEYSVWGFKPLHQSVYCAAPFCEPHLDRSKENITANFFQALGVLENLRLVHPVTYLVDNDSEDGEEMWPIPLDHNEECERVVGAAAAEAACLMLTDKQVEWGKGLNLAALCPVQKHIADVQAIGIYRLRHRPHTAATKAWFADLQVQCKAAATRFNELIAEIGTGATKYATSR